uniref:Zgc:136870 n=1 Tax=Scleropages formosus TaxID=113540 RepID=A0A8C9R3E6_SCLFO
MCCMNRHCRELPEIRLVLLGGRNSGKSSAGNIILGRAAFQIDTRSMECVWAQSETGEKRIMVVDTPGWDYFQAEPVQQQVKQQLASSLHLCRPGPHAFLLVIPIDSEVLLKKVEAHMELLGSYGWDYTLVLFTCGDRLQHSTIEEHIESRGRALKSLTEKCGNRIHVLNSYEKQDRSQVNKLLDKIENMAGTRSRSYYHIRLWQHEQEHTGESKRDKEEGAGNRGFPGMRESATYIQWCEKEDKLF